MDVSHFKMSRRSYFLLTVNFVTFDFESRYRSELDAPLAHDNETKSFTRNVRQSAFNEERIAPLFTYTIRR